MKKILNGMRFDTNTAEKVGEWDNGLPANDFSTLGETLYRTKRRKQFFLHGEGGPMTWCAKSSGPNTSTGGQEMRLMTDAEAFEWAQRHMSPDDVEDYFEVAEG